MNFSTTRITLLKTMLHAAFTVLTAVFTGCGGGTIGTSSTDGVASKILSGAVVNELGAALPGVAVRLIETGPDSSRAAARFGLNSEATTDSLGRFTLGLNDSAAILEVEAEGSTEQFPLDNLSSGVSIVGVRIQLARIQSSLSKVELIVNSIGGGDCEGIFGEARTVDFNGEAPPLVVIDQEESVDGPTVCTASITVIRDGAATAGTPFQLIFVEPIAIITKSVQAQGVTDAVGSGVVTFSLPLNEQEDQFGFFVVEAPTDVGSEDRVGIVINPLLRN